MYAFSMIGKDVYSIDAQWLTTMDSIDAQWWRFSDRILKVQTKILGTVDS